MTLPIQLDAEREDGDPRLEELRDKARSAVEAVRYWEDMLKQRVGEAEALDGWLATAVSTLLGTREQRLDEAVARVQEARTRLATARQAAQAARAEVEAAEARDRELQDSRTERIMQLELLADEIRGSSHTAAGPLDQLELALEEARLQLAPLTEALQAGEGLVAYLGSVAAVAGQARQAAEHDLVGIPLAGLSKMGRLQQLQGRLKELKARGQRFEEALSALGLEIALGLGDTEAPSYAFELLADNFFLDLSSMERIRALADRLDLARDEVLHVLEPLRARRAEVTARIEDLEARRKALLEDYLT